MTFAVIPVSKIGIVNLTMYKMKKHKNRAVVYMKRGRNVSRERHVNRSCSFLPFFFFFFN